MSAGDGGLVLSATTEFCASLTTEGLALKYRTPPPTAPGGGAPMAHHSLARATAINQPTMTMTDVQGQEEAEAAGGGEQEEAMEEAAQPELKQEEEKMDEEEKEERPKSGFRVVEPGKATSSSTTSVTRRIIKAEAAVKAEPQLESVP